MGRFILFQQEQIRNQHRDVSVPEVMCSKCSRVIGVVHHEVMVIAMLYADSFWKYVSCPAAKLTRVAFPLDVIFDFSYMLSSFKHPLNVVYVISFINLLNFLFVKFAVYRLTGQVRKT